MKETRNIKKRIGLIVSTAGILCVLFAFSAGFLGIDHDVGWGPARRFLLGSGILLVVIPHISRFLGLIAHTIADASSALGIDSTGYSQKLLKIRARRTESEDTSYSPPLAKQRKIHFTVLLILALSILMSSWLISVGRWTDWINSTNYYHLLAEGFRSGQSNLAVDPPQELLDLPDPYDVQAREGLTYLWDVSLFDGKYYLYWGPVPGALVLLIETVSPWTMGDNVLVWLFVTGCSALLLLLLRFIWIELLPDVPWWTFTPVALLAAFVNPLTWVLTRPAVYEAAITGGQFFFLGGVYWFLTGIYGTKASNWRYFYAGLSWTLAVGSRVTLSIPVFSFVLVLIAWLLINRNRDVELQFIDWRRFAALLVPLAIGALLLAFYNYERFGSLFELGHRFQLGRTNKFDQYLGVVGLLNVPQNLFNYTVNGVRTISVFPYIKPTWGKYAIPFLRYFASSNYHTEQVAGVLLTTPFILFSIAPILAWMCCYWRNLDAEEETINCKLIATPKVRKVYLWLWVAATSTFLPLLLLRVNSMRHEADFVPVSLLLAAIGYAWTYHELSKYVWLERILMIGVWILALLSSIVALLLAITGYNAVFENLNPQLFDKLVRFFTL